MAAKAPGTIIVAWEDPNEQRRENIIVINTRSMTVATVLSDLPIVEYQHGNKVFKPGDKLSLFMYHTGTTEAMSLTAAGGLSVPITLKNLRTGKKEEAEIEGVGKYAFTADVVTGTKDTWERIGYYTVPLGQEFVLGKRRAFNSRLLLDLYTAA